MANVSYFRSTAERSSERFLGADHDAVPPRRRRGRYAVAAVLLVVIAAVVVAGVALYTSKGSLSVDDNALATVNMPLGGAKIESVFVTGPHGRGVPVVLRGKQIWPKGKIPVGTKLSIDVVIKRPGWMAWLTGKTRHLRLTLTTPKARLTDPYLTLKGGSSLPLRFSIPVAAVSYGSAGALRRHVLSQRASEVSIARSGVAGSLFVTALPRTWETAKPQVISWFPAGSATSAVANPAPGSRIGPNTQIVLTFSKTVQQALGSNRPPVSPITQGTWHQVNSHAIAFKPQGYGYGLGAQVNVGLPSGVKLIGGASRWSVAPATTLRLQQVLSLLGYLPFNYKYANSRGVALTPQAQDAAAVRPPQGTFDWRYGNVPSELRRIWAPGTLGELTRGAIMSFENNQGMTADGVAGPTVWKALIAAVISGHKSTFGYTFVHVSESSPETINVWHSGKTVVTGLVNTGIPAAPTAQGVFAVFEHSLSVTMSGTNPDGSHYSDPGVPYTSYFNGGDALHGFIRASYGTAQSLGCVEMPYSEAGRVYPYTPIGTIVDVT